MKLKLLLLSTLLFGLLLPLSAQERYLDEVFSDVTVTNDIKYGENFSILPIILGQSQNPVLVDLELDIYEPSGDTVSERPVVILTHAGDFLPPVLNTIPFGQRKDSSLVQFCMEFAKRGFVAISMTHRQGWNPTSPVALERTQGILEASVRATQDMHTAVRWLRKTYSEDGNPYRIDSAKIAAGGEDAAGFASTNLIFLGDLSEAALPKFLDFSNNPPTLIIDTTLWGNIQANVARPLCNPNHVAYSSKVSMGFSLQGGLGDFDWIDSMEAPYVGVQNVADYNSNGIRDVTPGASGDILFADGAWADTIAFRSAELGNNSVFDQPMNNPIVDLALQRSGGVPGMLVLQTPARDTGQVICDSTAGVAPDSYGNNNDPWAWYNEQWYAAAWAMFQVTPAAVEICRQNLGNPNDAALSKIYVDTVATYLAYHMVLAMNIPNTTISSVRDLRSEVNLKVYPNPATETVRIEAEKIIRGIELIDMQGRVVQRVPNLRMMDVEIRRENYPPGVYGLRIQFDEGIVTDKVIWK
ncbi:MAG: T9SS type A sorting domain-containing protein [Bacteroidota bacterium]